MIVFNMTDEFPESRQERRDKKHQAEREKMAKHGKNLAQIYKDALMKRLGLGNKQKRE